MLLIVVIVRVTMSLGVTVSKIDDHFISSDHEASIGNLTNVVTCESAVPRSDTFLLEHSP